MERNKEGKIPVHRGVSRRGAAVTMAAALAVSCVPAAAADEIGSGVTPTYDEAYYATLDYYGNLTEGSVVKSYNLNGATSVTDYGDYDQVTNLTDGTQPTSQDGETVFKFDSKDTPDRFYFEGKTAKPFEAMPWTVSMTYKLNGVTTKAEDLAGKTGLVEIDLDLVPNANASDYAKNNYILMATTVFNQDDILSLKAEGAQVQLIGNLRMVMFMALPGEEEHFTIEVGSNDFSFDGMTFLLAPATLTQLDQIAELGERKEELQSDYDKLSGSLDTLLDSMGNMSSSLYDTANGLDELDGARGTISAGKGQIYSDTDKVQGDLNALTETLAPVAQQAATAGQALSDTKTALQTLTTQMTSLRIQLENLQDDIEDMQDHKSDLQDMLAELESTETQLASLKTTLASMSTTALIPAVELPAGMISAADMQSAQTLIDTYDEVRKTDGSVTFPGFMAAALLLGGKASTLEEAEATADSLNTAYTNLTQEQADALGGETATAWHSADQMHQVWETAQETETFQNFAYGIQTLSGDSNAQSTAESLNELYTMISLLSALNATTTQVNNKLKTLAAPSAALMGKLAALTDELDVFYDLLDDADDMASIAATTASKGEAILDSIQTLDDIFNTYEPTAQETLKTVQSLSENASASISDIAGFIGDFKALAQNSGTQLDSGTEKTLEGLAQTLRQAAKSASKTGDVKSAKNNISSIIEDTWKEHTGDMDNLLNMDSTAAAVSMTSVQNPAPTSIQVLLRTQEIKVADQEDTAQAETKTDHSTFWSRMGRMFEDFWHAVTGVFH